MQKSTVQYQGLNLAVESYNLQNRKAGTPVLCFIHGWCCSKALWVAQAPLFAQHPTILIDSPGHGESDKPEDVKCGIESTARAIHAVLQASNINEVVLVGHSMGGAVSTMILRLFGTDLVKGIIYVSSFWNLPAHYLSFAEKEQWAKALENTDIFWSTFSSEFTDKTTPAIRKQLEEVMVTNSPMQVRVNSGMFNEVPQHWRWDEMYPIPMLHIDREENPAWDPQHKRHLPNLVLEKWSGYSHFFYMEDPERFNARVNKFLADNHLNGAS